MSDDCPNCERLHSRIEWLNRGIKQAIEWFERLEPGADGSTHPIWQDAADHLREFYLEASDE